MMPLLFAALLLFFLAGCSHIPGPPVGRVYTDTGQCIEALRDPMGWMSFRECSTAGR